MNRLRNNSLALENQHIAQKNFHLSLKQAHRAFEVRDYESAINWIYFAATLAWHTYPGFFYSDEIETTLEEIGQQLIYQKHHFTNLPSLSNECSNKKKILHVLSTAYLKGGHTRVVKRWIENCIQYCPNQVHSIIITNQGKNIIPDWLVKSVKDCGGQCIAFPENLTWMQKAYSLKSIAEEWADIIVLHIHPNDPIPNVAFSSRDYDIPIFYYNHADHVFSIGMSISDIILDIRKSGQKVTNIERGFGNKSLLLPIPLIDTIPFLDRNRESRRIEARNRLKISPHEKILLTIGDEYKFKPALGYNFAESVKRILLTDSTIHIYAVGLPNNGLWKRLSDETKGHFHAVGIITDYQILEEYYLAADIYIESFPFSSLTAMLDAGLYMLPIQRMNNPSAPILSGDDVALDHLVSIANSEEEYIINTIKLIDTPSETRNNLGQKIRSSIIVNHCGEAWINKWLRPIIEKVDTGEYKTRNITQRDDFQVNFKFSRSLSISLSRWKNRPPILILLDALIRCNELPRAIRFRILVYSLHDVKLRYLFPPKNIAIYSILYIMELTMALLPLQKRKDLKNFLRGIKEVAKVDL